MEFLRVYFWSWGFQNAVVRAVSDRVSNSFRMNSIDSFLVGSWWNNAVLKVRLHRGTALRGKRVLHLAGTRWERDNAKGGMIRLHRASEILRGEQMKMILNRQNLGLRVQMIYGCSGVTTGDKTERFVLDELEATDGRCRIVRIDDWSRVIEERANEGLEGRRQTLLVMSEGGVRKGSKDVESRAGLACHSCCMGAEREGRIEGDAEQFRIVLLRNGNAVKHYRREAAELTVPWREQSHC